MAPQNMPAAEVEITTALVRRLLHEQHPDLAGLALTPLANGWDNVIFRLGAELSVRMPRRQLAAQLVVNEAVWLAGWAARLPIPIPEPVRTGRPGAGYPWHWNICPWFPGEPAADHALADPHHEARRLGRFLATFHVPVPDGGPDNPFRGQPVRELASRVRANLDRLGEVVDVAVAWRRFEELSAVDEWDGPPTLVHGDLHTANILVDDGAISAIIDFGDITAGDPAVDFAVAWMLFDADGRAALRAAAGGLDDALWSRAEAWALHFALLYALHSADNPRFARMGRRLLATVVG